MSNLATMPLTDRDEATIDPEGPQPTAGGVRETARAALPATEGGS